MDLSILHRVVTVRAGAVHPTGSWIYVWIDVDQKNVSYVGGTGFDPELRAHLHLTAEDPNIGRVRVLVPHAAEGNFDVLAFALPDKEERPQAKAELMCALARLGLFGGESTLEAGSSPLTEARVMAVRERLRTLRASEH